MVHDGVQKGVLWCKEALHHRHLVLNGWNVAHSYLTGSSLWFHSSENLEEKATVPLTIPQCSDAGRVFPPVKKTSQNYRDWSFPCSINLWGNELRGAVKLLLVFSPSATVFQDHSKSSACLQSSSTHCVSCHLALLCLSPSSPSIQTCEPSLFLCAFISYLSRLLSLSEHTSSFTWFLFLVTGIFHIHYCHF